MEKIILTIGIPAYDSWQKVSRVIHNLIEQKTEIPYEIIVVDDCHPEQLHEKVKDNYPTVITVKNATNQGPAFSRNRIIELAHGTYVAFLDADCIVPEDWVEKIGPYLNGDVLLSGKVVRNNGAIEWGARKSLWFGISLATTKQDANVASSNNMVVSTNVAKKVGGFCEELGIYFEDSLFSILCCRERVSFTFMNDVVVIHDHDSRVSPKRLYNQSRNTIWAMGSLYRSSFFRCLACLIVLSANYLVKSFRLLLLLKPELALCLLKGTVTGIIKVSAEPLQLKTGNKLDTLK